MKSRLTPYHAKKLVALIDDYADRKSELDYSNDQLYGLRVTAAEAAMVEADTALTQFIDKLTKKD